MKETPADIAIPANTHQHEDIEKHHDDGINVAHGFSAKQDTLPPGYYRSWKFIGTMLATGLGLASAVGGFALAAPNLTLINNEIGPDKNIVWVSLVYTLTLAVGLILVGRITDLFGRRVSRGSACQQSTETALSNDFQSGFSSAQRFWP